MPILGLLSSAVLEYDLGLTEYQFCVVFMGKLRLLQPTGRYRLLVVQTMHGAHRALRWWHWQRLTSKAGARWSWSARHTRGLAGGASSSSGRTAIVMNNIHEQAYALLLCMAYWCGRFAWEGFAGVRTCACGGRTETDRGKIMSPRRHWQIESMYRYAFVRSTAGVGLGAVQATSGRHRLRGGR